MTQYVKIPKERVGVIIGPKGETKKSLSRTRLHVSLKSIAKAER